MTVLLVDRLLEVVVGVGAGVERSELGAFSENLAMKVAIEHLFPLDSQYLLAPHEEILFRFKDLFVFV